MGKMTDAEIKQALEHCKNSNCLGCPCHSCDETCLDVLTPNALDLINRKDAALAELQRKNEELEIELKAMRGAANSYKAEVERLKKLTDAYFKVSMSITRELMALEKTKHNRSVSLIDGHIEERTDAE